jgi:hypothetical protein
LFILICNFSVRYQTGINVHRNVRFRIYGLVLLIWHHKPAKLQWHHFCQSATIKKVSIGGPFHKCGQRFIPTPH